MKILYLHGLYSKPGGKKPTHLAALGHTVINPGMPDDDFGESVRVAQAAYDEGRPDVVVGSSRGGAVAMNIETGTTPVVLIAPAWRRWGSVRGVKPGTVILHSEGDTVIPVDDSRALVASSGPGGASLVVVGVDHNMVDDGAFRALASALDAAARAGG